MTPTQLYWIDLARQLRAAKLAEILGPEPSAEQLLTVAQRQQLATLRHNHAATKANAEVKTQLILDWKIAEFLRDNPSVPFNWYSNLQYDMASAVSSVAVTPYKV